MLATILMFELRSRVRRASTAVYCASFFVLGFLFMNVSAGAFTSVSASFGGKVLANAPIALNLSLTFVSYLAVLITAAVFGDAIHKDVELGTGPLLFSTRLTKRDYLVGRFLGATVYVLLINGMIALGLWLATLMPWLDPVRLGPNRWIAYVQPYLTVVIPNILVTGAVFFGLAAWQRRILPVYMAGVVLLIGYLIATSIDTNIEHRAAASLLDPFGITAVGHLTEYWTVYEKNFRVVPLRGLLLTNRLLWGAFGAAIFAAAYARFSFAAPEEKRVAASKEAAVADHEPLVVEVTRDFSAGAWLGALPMLVRRELSETIRNVYFVVILFAGLLFLFFASTQLGSIFGTATYPVTYSVIALASGTFSLFILIILTFYSGEILFRDREFGVAAVIDATPAPTGLLHAAKFGALLAINGLLLCLVLASCVLIQVTKGYFHIEWGLYARELFLIQAVEYLAIASLTLTAQVLLENKYVAYLVSILYFIFTLFAARLGFEHQLARVGQMPTFAYSDMNGFGPYVKPLVAYGIAWFFFATILGVVRQAFYPRGLVFTPRERIAVARQRFRPALVALTIVGVVGFLGAAGIIVYNTNVLNEFTTDFRRGTAKAEYERKYRATRFEPNVKVSAIDLHVELYPEERRGVIDEHMRLENRSGKPVSRIFLVSPIELAIEKLVLSQPSSLEEDKAHGIRILTLAEALPPGASTELDARLVIAHRGFVNGVADNSVAGNGSFVLSSNLLHVGYNEAGELSDDDDRKKHGLAPKEQPPAQDDPFGLSRNAIGDDADWIRYEATIGTTADQKAITTGYLEREWMEGPRHYFHYRLDTPILNIIAIQSARYAERTDRWGDVDLAIDYHPGHEFNLDRMFKAMKASLAYFSTTFSPYQYKVLRIVEFPRYANFAISLPNTVPYSESIGFIAKVDEKDEKDIDYPFYITCHEVAHQWWGHQLVAAGVRGAAVTSESLAQYSALMVMKKTFGHEHMGRFLRYEMNRYLLGRSVARKKERPLVDVETQPYIYYQKGSVVMYALQDFIGQDKIDEALHELVTARAFKGAPYPTSKDVEAALLAKTPDRLKYLVRDGFETITLYENRALEATAKRRDDGRYDITLKYSAKKLRADGIGQEQEAPLADMVEFAVLDAKGTPLLTEKREVEAGEHDVTFVVDGVAAKAGIDPFNVLIDRQPDDNLVSVTNL